MIDKTRDLHAVVVEMKDEAVHILLPLECRHIIDFMMKKTLSMTVTERAAAIEVTFWERVTPEQMTS